jgi:hypothetical protein
VRLCLDELYSPDIAAQLRQRGHDVISVHDRPALVGLPDPELMELMSDEGRAVLTENAGDFVPLVARLALEGRDHFGPVLTSSASLPRSRNTIGRYVRALDAFLAERRADDALVNQIAWLAPPD